MTLTYKYLDKKDVLVDEDDVKLYYLNNETKFKNSKVRFFYGPNNCKNIYDHNFIILRKAPLGSHEINMRWGWDEECEYYGIKNFLNFMELMSEKYLPHFNYPFIDIMIDLTIRLTKVDDDFRHNNSMLIFKIKKMIKKQRYDS